MESDHELAAGHQLVNWEIAEYKGFWVRVLAHIIDGLLLSLLTLPLVWYFFGLSKVVNPNVIPSTTDIMIKYVLPAIAVVLFWRYKSATPGKMIINAKIVDATTGGKLSMQQCMIRYFSFFVITLPGLFAVIWVGLGSDPKYTLYLALSSILLLGAIWVGVDKRKQGLHDKFANTVVIDSDYMPIEDAQESDEDGNY